MLGHLALSIMGITEMKETCTVKPVLSDHIKQDIFLAFQTGGCLLLHEKRTESACMIFLQAHA